VLVEGLRGREAANWSRRRVATQGQFLIVLDELEGLLLSATVNGGTLVNVHDWLSDNTSPERVAIQEQHGYNLHARSLKGLHASAVETRSSRPRTSARSQTCRSCTPPGQPRDYPAVHPAVGQAGGGVWGKTGFAALMGRRDRYAHRPLPELLPVGIGTRRTDGLVL